VRTPVRILFGHQSVGQNIIEGIAELAGQGWPVPRVVDADADADADVDADLNPPVVLAHFRIGANGDPLSKLADFAGKVSAEQVSRPRAALFKFCYVDLFDREAVAPLFDAYVKTMRALQQAREDVAVGHMTIPLRAVPPGLLMAGMRLLGRPHPQLVQNAARHEFNERLRDRFAAAGYFFDLAAIESGGCAAAPALQRRFTDDGGHLNARGRRHVAAEFVRFLTQLARSCT